MASGLQDEILSWYKPEIGPRLKPDIRNFIERYCGLAEDEVEDRLYSIVRPPFLVLRRGKFSPVGTG